MLDEDVIMRMRISPTLFIVYIDSLLKSLKAQVSCGIKLTRNVEILSCLQTTVYNSGQQR